MFKDLIDLLLPLVPSEARIIFAQFRGDPTQHAPRKWRARVFRDESQIDPHGNVYFCVSCMRRNSRGEFRRRSENWRGGMLLMIDDLGDGPGSKFPLKIVDSLPPTLLVETSPANYQALYVFDRLVEDRAWFDGLIRGFIERQFLGTDTGQAGANRVFRPPVGVNDKPKYGGGFEVRGHAWTGKTYDPVEVARAFDIDVSRPRVRLRYDATVDSAERIRFFKECRAALRRAGMLKDEEFDLGGWAAITCPWVEGHTGSVDNGAAIRLPAEENAWSGAFRCHHASCEGKGWGELSDWLLDEVAWQLERANDEG